MHSWAKHNTARVEDQHHVFTHRVFNARKMKSVGERIRQARAYRGLTAEELASKVGYQTQSGISNLENRHTGRGGFMLPKIAKELDFDVAWFLQGPDTDDMSTVAPFEPDYRRDQRKADNMAVCEERRPYTLRETAHALVDNISDAGLVHAVVVLQGLADTHPEQHPDRAGLLVPAPKRHIA